MVSVFNILRNCQTVFGCIVYILTSSVSSLPPCCFCVLQALCWLWSEPEATLGSRSSMNSLSFYPLCFSKQEIFHFSLFIQGDVYQALYWVLVIGSQIRLLVLFSQGPHNPVVGASS